jgi:bifunctional DNA-binding transcriptional regulator/antitoxin component of YhaV-PrlF toxin-antitoxin module
MSETTLIKVDHDGAITIPRDVVQTLGLGPDDRVRLEPREGGARLFGIKSSPVPLSAEDRQRWEQITQLLQETLADADWEEIHSHREERCF